MSSSFFSPTSRTAPSRLGAFLALAMLLTGPSDALADNLSNIWDRTAASQATQHHPQLQPVTGLNPQYSRPPAPPELARLTPAPNPRSPQSLSTPPNGSAPGPTPVAAPPGPIVSRATAFPSQAPLKIWPAPAAPAPQNQQLLRPQVTPVAPPQPTRPPGAQATARDLLIATEALARQPLVYQFGSNDPATGSLDCSGTIQTLLKQVGYPSVPRTAYEQFRWLEENRLLHKVRRGTPDSRIYAKLRPGQLLFWKGTYKSSNPVTHVMVYMGRDRAGQHYMFGARGASKRGFHGNGVDVFKMELDPKNKSKSPLVGYGDVPKLAYVY